MRASFRGQRELNHEERGPRSLVQNENVLTLSTIIIKCTVLSQKDKTFTSAHFSRRVFMFAFRGPVAWGDDWKLINSTMKTDKSVSDCFIHFVWLSWLFYLEIMGRLWLFYLLVQINVSIIELYEIKKRLHGKTRARTWSFSSSSSYFFFCHVHMHLVESVWLC